KLPYDHSTFSGETRLIDLARNQFPPINQFIDRDWSQARFTSRIEAMSSADLAWLIKKVDSYAGQKLDPRFEYKVTGIVKLLANMIDKVRDSQVASLALAIVLLWICFIVFLRSAVVGTLAMLPNIIPIVTTLGLMGILKIELDLATVMMPSIAIGLAVDDTLHFFSAFRSRALAGDTGPEAIRWTLHFRGRAFLYTSFVLAAGFGILLLSDLRPVADFGIISCAAIASALLADLLFNPALLKLARPKLADWSEQQ
ncbi:MAG: MMPL family transporter, partial [Chrysiogenetes bacterium]|nr:MMPL family transporter [Chrysiogenetes bacterium]